MCYVLCDILIKLSVHFYLATMQFSINQLSLGQNIWYVLYAILLNFLKRRQH